MLTPDEVRKVARKALAVRGRAAEARGHEGDDATVANRALSLLKALLYAAERWGELAALEG